MSTNEPRVVTETFIAEVRERYNPVSVPPCRICGGALSLEDQRRGWSTWRCTGRVDGEYTPGRKPADDHYGASTWEDRSGGGDAGVLFLCDALEARGNEIEELRAKLATAITADEWWSHENKAMYLRLVATQCQLADAKKRAEVAETELAAARGALLEEFDARQPSLANAIECMNREMGRLHQRIATEKALADNRDALLDDVVQRLHRIVHNVIRPQPILEGTLTDVVQRHIESLQAERDTQASNYHAEKARADEAESRERGTTNAYIEMSHDLNIRLDRSEASVAAMREALTIARGLLPRNTDAHYGHFHGGDPRSFFPDAECCTPDEMAAHQAACEAAERGEPSTAVPHRHAIEVVERDGEQVVGVASYPGSFGFGTTTVDHPEIQQALDKIDAALAPGADTALLDRLHAAERRAEALEAVRIEQAAKLRRHLAELAEAQARADVADASSARMCSALLGMMHDHNPVILAECNDDACTHLADAKRSLAIGAHRVFLDRLHAAELDRDRVRTEVTQLQARVTELEGQVAGLEAEGPAAREEALRSGIERELDFDFHDPNELRENLRRVLDRTEVSDAGLRLTSRLTAAEMDAALLHGEITAAMDILRPFGMANDTAPAIAGCLREFASLCVDKIRAVEAERDALRDQLAEYARGDAGGGESK